MSTEPPITLFLAKQLSTSHWYDISAARSEILDMRQMFQSERRDGALEGVGVRISSELINLLIGFSQIP